MKSTVGSSYEDEKRSVAASENTGMILWWTTIFAQSTFETDVIEKLSYRTVTATMPRISEKIETWLPVFAHIFVKN